jgi:RecB family endonuclease NucS
MAGTEIRLKSERRLVERLPFASESGLQRFVKEHAKDLLGLKVVAVAERGGGMISKIDVLAIDRSGQPWIIECKHDLVKYRAVDQLKR